MTHEIHCSTERADVMNKASEAFNVYASMIAGVMNITLDAVVDSQLDTASGAAHEVCADSFPTTKIAE